ncbi:hypothetical protein BGZ65_012345, partial [Modicella reniformis]
MIFSGLSTPQILELANCHLENARRTQDPKLKSVLCNNAESALSWVETFAYWNYKHAGDQSLNKKIYDAFTELGVLQEQLGQRERASASHTTVKKYGKRVSVQDQSTLSSEVDRDVPSTRDDIATLPPHIFVEDIGPPVINIKLPKAEDRLENTLQLAFCLGVLQSPNDIVDMTTRTWQQTIGAEEQKRLKKLATDVIRAFKSDGLQNSKAVVEVVQLAPVLEKEDFRCLLEVFRSGIKESEILCFHHLEGLAQVIQGASPGYLDADDLVRILKLLGERLRSTHKHSQDHKFRLTLTMSNVLDAMTNTGFKDLDRVNLHDPLSSYLERLEQSSDPYLVYQAAYAYQALQCISDDETLWKSTLRRTGKVLQGVFMLAGAVKGLDINEFLENIQKGVAAAQETFWAAKKAHDTATSLFKNGEGPLKFIEVGFSIKYKRAWYTALRGADVFIEAGQFAKFRRLICEAPCRRDEYFHRKWETDIRRSAIELLGEIYRNDAAWDEHQNVKQWILKILMQLKSLSEVELQGRAEDILNELKKNGDANKQERYQACRSERPGLPPLKVSLSPLESSCLLDRAQEKKDVDSIFRRLKNQQMNERVKDVYIPPRAKPEDSQFQLMENVKKFLDDGQMVYLILGDSGAGKSTFNRQLELVLWKEYEKNIARVPLHISLPAIDKPEHDMIVKKLRKVGFTYPQIKELKETRHFVLICDGYDEIQLTQNLYMKNRLNQPGEWKAQLVVSCRSECLGVDYRDRFQPGDQNHSTNPAAFQEAIIAAFSEDQIEEYIKEYKRIHQPLWKIEDYQRVLNSIPGLKELVKNPFMLTLSLEVLPRMVDLGKDLSVTRVTRVALYDQFVEQWFERGKRRITQQKDLTQQAKSAFDSLNDEGFTQNGINFLKHLALAIYKEQDGQPVVEYLHFKDKGTWKAAFFGRGDEKQLLREACPLTRNESQHQFMHRSLLEYGLARAIFDPTDIRKQKTPMSVRNRRGSVSSLLSLDIPTEAISTVADDKPEDLSSSPLIWKSFVNERSLMQFLQERVQHAPLFKEELLIFIEDSKVDKKWRTAAANAITILVRAGVQFNGTDLRGIQIPMADLSHGVFDSVQFQGADLRRVNFRNAWLRQADFRKARMSGVQFGEFLAEDDKVLSCTYSPDGKSFAVGLENGDVSVYTTSNRERMWTLKDHTGPVTSVVYSPKGSLIASGSEDKTVRLSDVATKSCRSTLEHDGKVTSVVYSPNDDMIVSGCSDGKVWLWDVETATSLQIIPIQTNQGQVSQVSQITSVAYSSMANMVISGSSDGLVYLWGVKTGSWLHPPLQGHNATITSIAYSPERKQFASASEDHTVLLWDLVWDLEAKRPNHTLSGHDDEVTSVVYSPKGDLIVSGSKDKTVMLWDTETGALRRILRGHIDRITSVAYSPKGLVASGSWDMTIRLWDVEAGARNQTANDTNKRISGVAYSPSGDLIATGSSDGTVRLWDTKTGTPLQTFSGHQKDVISVIFSPIGDLVASIGIDHEVRLWDAKAGCRHVFVREPGLAGDVAFSPEGDMIASGSVDNNVQLWNVQTGECHSIFSGHTNTITSVTFSPNGDLIAAGSEDRTVRLWNAKARTYCCTLSDHDGEVMSVAFSPKGDLIASGSRDKTVRLWNPITGTCRQTLSGHEDTVTSVTYLPTMDLVASGSDDMTVRLWVIASGHCREVIQCSSKVTGVASSTTSSIDYLVTGCDDGSVRLWKVVDEMGQCHVFLQWSSGHEVLTLANASIRDVRGLSRVNTQLVKQRGAEGKPGRDIATIPAHIFDKNVSLPNVKFKLPDTDERLDNTPQLAYCLSILQDSAMLAETAEQTIRHWLQTIKDDTDEQTRLEKMAKDVIDAFKKDTLRDARAVAEVLYLVPILGKEAFADLLNVFHHEIQSSLPSVHLLEGFARLIQDIRPGYLDAGGLVNILELLSTRLRDIQHQPPHHIYQLTLTVSHVLDAMADAEVKDLEREKLHEPLSSYLDGLKESSDPFLVYQAAYVYQAIQYVPDIALWRAALRRTGKSAMEDMDLNMFIEDLVNIQQVLVESSEVFELTGSGYEWVTPLTESGKVFLSCLKEGLAFECKQAWYPALRGADILIQNGQFVKFKKLVCEVPCRCNPAFQWGLCQRLGEVAANPMWDLETRQSAVAFLGEIYPNETLLKGLEASGSTQKQALYRACREEGPSAHPLKITSPELECSTFLNHVQKNTSIEHNLRQLRKQQLKEQGVAVYIPLQAKASLQATDDARFQLIEKINEFLRSDKKKVFLLLGDDGAGKSTFNRALERDLWKTYRTKADRIPLHINLPAIDKPEHDMIAKQLRKAEFTEPQIRELKVHRNFILICDGYDESQLTHNLYTSNRLNHRGEWSAQMVISCRSEYIGVDYRDRFQPSDRNRQPESGQFQEAVLTPFSADQIEAYITQYVLIHQPLWQTKDYKQAMELIPSLKDLVKNPFLMTLSLEVLPRLVDPGQDLSAARITRVELYDQFVEQWLERGKKRLGEKQLSSQAKAAFDNLSDEGFILNGIDYLKKMAVAIYKEQGGHPIIEYSRFKDEGSWKDAFFTREDKQLLREACPLTRS